MDQLRENSVEILALGDTLEKLVAACVEGFHPFSRLDFVAEFGGAKGDSFFK